MHERGCGDDRRGGHRQRLVVDDDGLGAVDRAVRVVGDDDRHGLAHVTYALAGHHRMHVDRPLRLADERRYRGAKLGRVANGEGGEHAGAAERRGGVDAEHPGVGVGAADQRQMHHTRQAQVVDETTAAGEEPPVLLALERGADQERAAAPSARRWTSR